MGVPGFFGWLVQRCRAALVAARNPNSKPGDKEKKETGEGEAELSRTQMDCLYLDLNGIIHPCCHPDTNAPTTEEEMMSRICQKIDEIVQLVRPTTLLFLAIDGTAPRAKMNQQRTRRFRAAQMRETEKDIIEEVKQDWLDSKVKPPADKDIEVWDSNVITPGTPFMDKVAKHLEYYLALRLSKDPVWEGLTVLFSGSNEPGEGEHKIIQYIKRQRMAPGYNPNTTHCIVGEDADLIMLAMSIHSPHIYILRGARPPRGREREKDDPRWNYLVISIITAYFEKVFQSVLTDESIPKEKRDLQRMLDDLTLVFCLVGNDFLPHIPGMKIQHNALAVSLLAYVEVFRELDGYLTDHGDIDLPKLGILLGRLSNNFRTVTDSDADRAAQEEMQTRPPPQPPTIPEIVQMNSVGKKQAFLATVKYHLDMHIERDIEEQKANDKVCVGKVGWEDRHYLENFPEMKELVDVDDEAKQEKLEDLKKDVAKEYLKGLCWVVAYYFQDCPSWSWYYPYHYSPVLNTVDCSVFEDEKMVMPPKSKPYTPFEQLSAVLPETTATKVLPKSITKWLINKKSPLFKFYPKSFYVDLRACPPPWHCTVILPFIEDKVYLPILKKLQKKVKDESDVKRNGSRPPMVLVGKANKLFKAVKKQPNGTVGYSKCNIAAQYTSGSVLTTLDSPFSADYATDYPTVEESGVAIADVSFPPLENKSMMLEGTNVPDHSARLKPGQGCKKPSFSFQSRTMKAGLPIVLQPGKALNSLQIYWAGDVLPCMHYANWGKCKYGDDCRYSHDADAVKNNSYNSNSGKRTASVLIDEAPREPAKKKQKKEVVDCTKLYICGGANMSRSDLETFISKRTGITPDKVKWKVPGGKSTGTAVVRFATTEQGQAVCEKVTGSTLPGSSHPLSVEKAPQKTETPAVVPAEAPPAKKQKKSQPSAAPAEPSKAPSASPIKKQKKKLKKKKKSQQ